MDFNDENRVNDWLRLAFSSVFTLTVVMVLWLDLNCKLMPKTERKGADIFCSVISKGKSLTFWIAK